MYLAFLVLLCYLHDKYDTRCFKFCENITYKAQIEMILLIMMMMIIIIIIVIIIIIITRCLKTHFTTYGSLNAFYNKLFT